MEKTIVITIPYWLDENSRDSLKKYFDSEFPNHKKIVTAIGSNNSYLTLHFYGDKKEPILKEIPLPVRVEKVEVSKLKDISFYLCIIHLICIALYVSILVFK